MEKHSFVIPADIMTPPQKWLQGLWVSANDAIYQLGLLHWNQQVVDELNCVVIQKLREMVRKNLHPFISMRTSPQLQALVYTHRLT